MPRTHSPTFAPMAALPAASGLVLAALLLTALTPVPLAAQQAASPPSRPGALPPRGAAAGGPAATFNGGAVQGQAAATGSPSSLAPSTPDEADALAHDLAVAEEEAGVTSEATTNDAGPVGIVPLLKGFNASLGYTVQHDSSSGWAGLFTPNLAYRFGPHFSLNTGIPVFARVNTYDVLTTKAATKTTAAQTTYGFQRHDFLLGDYTLVGAFEAHPALLDYALSATLGLPTGNDALGLGAGQPTYNVTGHFEHPVRWITPQLELGAGNSLNLDNTRVRKSFFTVGETAHFELGAGFRLPFSTNFSTSAFEDLPLSTQTVTTTTSNGKKGAQLKMITTTSEKSIGEDNGFLNTLDIPLSGHVILSGFYNRSLRNRIDTAGFSLTFILRPAPHGREPIQ